VEGVLKGVGERERERESNFYKFSRQERDEV
jgi:hypothetical protein